MFEKVCVVLECLCHLNMSHAQCVSVDDVKSQRPGLFVGREVEGCCRGGSPNIQKQMPDNRHHKTNLIKS